MVLKHLLKYQDGGLTPNKVQSIIDRYGRGRSPFTASDYITVANNTGVPVDLLLAQGIQESNLGTQGRAVRTRNVGNVGNTDDGTANYQNSWLKGLYRQANLLKQEYKVTDTTDVQRLVSNDFVRPIRGGKYATDQNYGSKVGNLLNKLHGKEVYKTNKTPQQQTEKKKKSNLPPMNGGHWLPSYTENNLPTSLNTENEISFWSLPSATQDTIIENQKLQQELLAQQAEADKLEQENALIEQGLKQKQFERQQLLNSIPQAQFIGDNSNLQPNPFVTLLQNS